MASWDDEDFDPDALKEAAVTDKWEGEDEDDDDIKDNWDDDEEEEKETKPVVESQPKKKKKTLQERIKEKEEKKRQEMLKKAEEAKQAEEADADLTPEEALAEKLRIQRLQEESDLQLAKEAFGVSEVIPGQKTIDNFEPSSKEEFQELAQMIVKKFSTFEQEKEYAGFLEGLFRDCCTGVDAEDIKRIGNSLTILASEKLKAQKSAKGGKKKPAKKALASGKGVAKGDFDNMDTFYDDYDDFM